MVTYVFANAPASPATLDSGGSGINNSTTTIALTSGDGAKLPSPGAGQLAIIRIDNEYITYDTRSTDTLSGCTRGVDGSSAASHSANTAVHNVASKLYFDNAAQGSSGLYSAYLLFQEQQTAGTSNGGITAGSYVTRPMNTEVVDTGNHGSVASNQITLDAGTYSCRISAPCVNCGNHKARLRDITNSATLLLGTNEYALASGASTPSWIVGKFTLAGSTVLEVQSRVGTTSGTFGLGFAANWGDTEIYGVAEFWKE